MKNSGYDIMDELTARASGAVTKVAGNCLRNSSDYPFIMILSMSIGRGVSKNVLDAVEEKIEYLLSSSKAVTGHSKIEMWIEPLRSSRIPSINKIILKSLIGLEFCSDCLTVLKFLDDISKVIKHKSEEKEFDIITHEIALQSRISVFKTGNSIGIMDNFESGWLTSLLMKIKSSELPSALEKNWAYEIIRTVCSKLCDNADDATLTKTILRLIGRQKTYYEKTRL